MANDGFAKPTPEETHFIDRFRRGETQRAAAKRLKMTLAAYSAMELGNAPAKRVAIGKLKANERCVLMRRRTGSTQLKVSREMGCCRWWVNRMEQGVIDCTPLVNYWES